MNLAACGGTFFDRIKVYLIKNGFVLSQKGLMVKAFSLQLTQQMQ